MSSDLHPPLVNASTPDPELEALPAPRRPWRRLTLFLMVVTTIASLTMAWSLRSEVRYALLTGRPVDAESLVAATLGPAVANRWVRAEAGLELDRAVRYRRPLESDEYRLFPVSGRPEVWVELRVPEPYANGTAHFIPPASFVGRLVPVTEAGLRYGELHRDVSGSVVADSRGGTWLLIDGEAPATVRWAIGLMAVFVAFAGFNLWGLVRLLRPVTGSD